MSDACRVARVSGVPVVSLPMSLVTLHNAPLAVTGQLAVGISQSGQSPDLVDTMAASNGPDVVGLVATDVTYGVVGDHGGYNRLVQNIPMVFSGPGVNPKDSSIELRHADVLPTILEAMGIDYDPADFDGEAVDLSKAKP